MTPLPVTVTWEDSRCTSGWQPEREARAHADQEALELHYSCGYLLADTSRYVLLALNYKPAFGDEVAQVADTMQIPQVAVRSLRPLIDDEAVV